jgi:hypothetical protein
LQEEVKTKPKKDSSMYAVSKSNTIN